MYQLNQRITVQYEGIGRISDGLSPKTDSLVVRRLDAGYLVELRGIKVESPKGWDTVSGGAGRPRRLGGTTCKNALRKSRCAAATGKLCTGRAGMRYQVRRLLRLMKRGTMVPGNPLHHRAAVFGPTSHLPNSCGSDLPQLLMTPTCRERGVRYAQRANHTPWRPACSGVAWLLSDCGIFNVWPRRLGLALPTQARPDAESCALRTEAQI